MISKEDIEKIQIRYETIKPYLVNEQQRKMYAISEVKALKQYGAITIVSKIMDISKTTITQGIKQAENNEITPNQIRKKGGGRKTLELHDSSLRSDLLKLLDDSTCGDPCSPLKWTCKSLHNLERSLKEMGREVSHMKIHKMMAELGYSMQGNMKAIEGNSQHPDRNGQFEIISGRSKEFIELGEPV